MNYQKLYEVIRPICSSYGDMFTIGLINGIMKSKDKPNFEKLDDISTVLETYLRKDENK